jgi:tight adherence protein B
LTNPRPLWGQRDLLRPLREFLQSAGLYDVTPRQFVLFSLASGAAAALFAQVALRWPFLTPVAALVGATLPLGYYKRRQERRRASFQTAVVDAVVQLRDGIRTGLAVQEALVGLAQTGPEPLRPEFRSLVRDMRLDNFEQALNAMRDRLADPLFDVLASTLILNEQLGGRNVSQVLDQLVNATRGQLRAEQEIRAQEMHNIVSVVALASIPVILLVWMRLANPGYLDVFTVWPGQLILIGSLLSLLAGYRLTRWFGRIPGEPRVLR